MKTLIKTDVSRQMNWVLSSVAHDLKAPLSTALALLDHPDELCEAKKIIVKRAVWRAFHMTESLLAESSSVYLESQVVPVEDLVHALVDEKKSLYPKIQFSILDLSKGNYLEQPRAFNLERALCCVLQNAVEALSRQEGPKIAITLQNKYSHLQISVEDNGPGIPINIRQKLGKEKITYMKEGGRGLGIYHSAKLMKMSRGSLYIRSRENMGTCVSLRIKA